MSKSSNGSPISRVRPGVPYRCAAKQPRNASKQKRKGPIFIGPFQRLRGGDTTTGQHADRSGLRASGARGIAFRRAFRRIRRLVPNARPGHPRPYQEPLPRPVLPYSSQLVADTLAGPDRRLPAPRVASIARPLVPVAQARQKLHRLASRRRARRHPLFLRNRLQVPPVAVG
jgi:hypothetical protein